MEHIWSITSLERNLNDGMVDKVFYNLRTTYNSHSIEFTDEIILTTGSASDGSFINYEDLTESVVLNWVKNSLDVNTLETNNSSSLNSLIIDWGNIKEQGIPW